jgi:hypothetical protein
MTVSIDSSTQFFIALAKKDAHSFIMLGTYTDYKVQHLLCRVGKIFDLTPIRNGLLLMGSIFTVLFKAVTAETKAKIENEGVSRTHYGHQPITYQAYDLSYKQYLEFIRILESMQNESNQFFCYKPIQTTANSGLLEYTNLKIFSPRPLSGELFDATNKLSVDNTCRHGAIRLVEEVIQGPVSSAVSSNFFTELPCQTYLDYGVPSQEVPFYVLPIPPNIYPSLSKEKRNVVVKLYRRMEELLRLEPNSAQTQQKFRCLKELYHQILEEQQELSLNDLLHHVQTWKKQNWTVLSALRKTYFWDNYIHRKAATIKFIEEIEDGLQPEEGDTNWFIF